MTFVRMGKIMYRLIWGFICFLITAIISGQNMNYQSFDNSVLSLEANSVRFFLQDEQGLMWIGTNKGLYSYDGYESFPHFIPGNSENRLINCGVFYKDDFILMGTDRGILMYNYKFDKYKPFEIEFSKDIRAMVLTGNDLWLGCADGLYIYNSGNKKIIKMLVNAAEPDNTGIIYSLLESNGYIYVEASGCLGRFSLNEYKYEQIEGGCGLMVNWLLKDEIRDCIWIGGASRLVKYSPSSNTFKNIFGFPVVKTIELDVDNNLVIGTDNGLYVYNGKETNHFVHNAMKSNSLANNIVWSVFKDRSDNIWLGTDFGVSLAPRHRGFDFIPIFQFSGTGEGNQFYCILKDSRDFYWLGGDNGLIRTRNLSAVDSEIRWYNMSKEEFFIPHSHIRDIFEDADNNLWIATDFGIGRYNYQTERFIRYFICNADYTQNANWAYDILEDQSGYLWISSFNGGIFKIDKKQLFSNQRIYVANAHYSTANGLKSNNIDQIVFDRSGNVWALNHNKGIDVLNVSTGLVTDFPIFNYTNGNIPNYLINDSDGNIWVGFRNGIVRIDPVNNGFNTIEFEDVDNPLVIALLQVGNNIWASSADGLWIINKDSFSVRHINITNKLFYSMYYNQNTDKILLGGADGIAECSPSILNVNDEKHKIIISSIMVNGKKYINENDELAVRHSPKIELPYDQNNVVIEFSDLQYSKEYGGRTYSYKVDNDDNKWTAIKANDNAIRLNKLNPGKYSLTIAEKESKNAPVKALKSIQIIINSPWYFSLIAKVIYALVLTGFIIWSIKFFNQRSKLKFERIEREKTIEQTKLKIDFFTNIAHEFKTPLSLIIAPLSWLIHKTKNNKEKDALEIVNQNAMKLNSLVHQAIEYYRDDSNVPVGLVLSRVEFVEFAKSIFFTYEESMKERQIDFIFNTNSKKLFVDIDVLKVESILNNLLSNAGKYTNAGDTIILSVEYSEKSEILELRVSDTGIGIPEKYLPYIFQRFFQSPSNGGREGTGVGLYLVKNFTELHGGSVNVISDTEEGTSFIVRLPAMVNSIDEPLETGDDEKTELIEKPLIVIVEDNVAIANFIYSIFIDEFRCVIAYNGKTGLKICTDLKPDIIISDIMMPVMDGLEMCQRLKRNIQTSTIPVILLTAKDDKETELTSINLKIDAFIAKPFDSNILYSRVKQMLEAQKQLGKKMRIEKLSTPVTENIYSEDEKFLAHITRIIEKHIDNPDLNVSYLCKEERVPQKQLYRKIKHLTGLTAVDYIKSIRMKKAAILLANKNFTIAEVMYKVGFSNHSYFAKCFNSEFGKTPRQFIEQ